jgi:hypothetical protein
VEKPSRQITIATLLAALFALSACAATVVPPRHYTGTPIELFTQLADIRALALVCDKRPSDVAAKDWAANFERRELSIEARVQAIYGEAAVQSAREVSVFGCYGGTSQLHRREYQAVLTQLETKLAR